MKSVIKNIAYTMLIASGLTACRQAEQPKEFEINQDSTVTFSEGGIQEFGLLEKNTYDVKTKTLRQEFFTNTGLSKSQLVRLKDFTPLQNEQYKKADSALKLSK